MFPFTKEKPKACPVRVGQVILNEFGDRYMVVVGVESHAQGAAIRAHYVDPETGLLMECPDKGRCGHGGGCPIHGKGYSWPKQAAQFKVMADYDLAMYAAIGMLGEDLAKAASATGTPPPLDPMDAKTARDLKQYFATRRATR